MNKVVSIIFSLIGVLILAGLVIGYVSLSSKQGKLAERVTKSQTTLIASEDEYAKCYNSVNYGSSTVMDVSLSYLKYDSTDAEKEKLNQIESDFMNEIEATCTKAVSDYEDEYRRYESSVVEYEKSGWINFLIGGGVVETSTGDLAPDRVRMNAGFPLTTLIFTKEDVQKFFDQRV
jgi:hypothetical protein